MASHGRKASRNVAVGRKMRRGYHRGLSRRVTNWSPARYLVRASLATAPRAASDQSARLALRPSYDWLASGSGVPLFRTLNSISHTFRSRIGCSSLAPIESIRLNLSAHFAAFHSGRGEYLREQSANWVECLLRLSLRRTITSVTTTEESAPASTTALRQELPLRRAKAEDRPGPYNPMYGLYIRAFVVACWAARLHFDMKGTDL